MLFRSVEGMVIGGHGDTTMIPLTRFATYKGMPVANFISEEKLNEVAAATMVGGSFPAAPAKEICVQVCDDRGSGY